MAVQRGGAPCTYERLLQRLDNLVSVTEMLRVITEIVCLWFWMQAGLCSQISMCNTGAMKGKVPMEVFCLSRSSYRWWWWRFRQRKRRSWGPTGSSDWTSSLMDWRLPGPPKPLAATESDRWELVGECASIFFLGGTDDSGVKHPGGAN